MRFNYALLCSLPFLLSCVAASTNSQLRCSTEMGPSSARHIPSSTRTVTEYEWPVILLTTSRSTQTVTPSPILTTLSTTTTITATATDSTVTDIFSTTSTDYATVTSTATFTSTSTSTTLTTVSNTVTTTVATTPGFLPIADTTASVFPAQKRSPGNPHGQSRPEKPSFNQGCKDKYPEAVFCEDVVIIQATKTVVYPGKPTTTTRPPVLITRTTTLTATSTSTVVPPDVSVTLSFSTTITGTTITTTTVTASATETDTVTLSYTTSAYAACASANLFSTTADGSPIANIYLVQNSIVTVASTNSAYNCCVSCITGADCQGTAFESGSGTCFTFTNNAHICPAQSTSPFYYTEGTGEGLVVSNGYCGYMYNGGRD